MQVLAIHALYAGSAGEARFGMGLISVEEADRLIAASLPRYGTERIPLADAAGRILAEPIVADRPQPPFDRVTMDGIAIAHAAWEDGLRRFVVRGVHGAGAPPPALQGPEDCYEVMTGAPLPAGADAVIPVEACRIEGGVAVVQAPSVRRGQNVHAFGSDCAAGAVWAAPGLRLNGPRVALAASAGYGTLAVARPPRLAVISTGDELAPVESEDLPPHRIRLSNAPACAAALRLRLGAEAALYHAPDDRDETVRQLEAALGQAEVVILSGGVSMGRFDHVPSALELLGVRTVFHKIAQRPGKPMWFGLAPGGQAVFGLPGNPVSTLTCLVRYVIPHLLRSMGAAVPPMRAALGREIAFTPDLTYFPPVRLEWGTDGRMTALPNPANTSGDHGALAPTDGVLELPRGQDAFPAGFVGSFYPW